ncbi:MAG TPA: type II secretion system F family protein [Phycisphaerales bacterium]|nr:type II secretion system F family protein [Phycisphaerales bacterium]
MTGVSRASPPSQYLYLAAKPDGGRTLGLRKARSQRHLSEDLRRQRLVALKTWTVPAWAGRGEDKVKLKDQAELHLQLAQLLTRAVPLVEALEVTATAVAPKTRPRVEKMREMVAAGSSFSDAAEAVGVFDRVTIAVYRSAERTGDLAGAAKQLAHTTRRQLAITGKVGTLMIYPIIVLSLSVLVSGFMLMVIVPRIGAALASSGTEVPWITQKMVWLGTTLGANFAWVALVLALLTVVVFGLRAHIFRGAMRFARVAPVLKDVVLTQESARFFTVMAAMTRSGVTLADALGVATTAIGHPRLRQQLTLLRTRLIEGGVLRVLIDSVDALPLATRRLLIAAERSGDLESAFDTLAEDMAVELDRKSTRALAALEPVLIIFMFLIIGSMVLVIMIPLIKSAAAAGG